MGSRETPGRWALIRDILVFQFKLFVDGIRDLILVPVSLVAGLISLLKGGDAVGTEFYDLLRYGHRTDRAINLFGAADRVHDPVETDDETDIDTLVSRVENFVVAEYQRGGITAQAKDRLDRALDAMSRNAESPSASDNEASPER